MAQASVTDLVCHACGGGPVTRIAAGWDTHEAFRIAPVITTPEDQRRRPELHAIITPNEHIVPMLCAKCCDELQAIHDLLATTHRRETEDPGDGQHGATTETRDPA